MVQYKRETRFTNVPNAPHRKPTRGNTLSGDFEMMDHGQDDSALQSALKVSDRVVI